MKIKDTTVMLCDCEHTMRLDADRIGGAGDEPPHVHHQLCRAQLHRFEAALGGDEPLLVACTQEAPLFSEVAAEAGRDDLRFVNIRERAGWNETGSADAKIAALLRDAVFKAKPALLKTVESDGLCLVYGSGQGALEAAKMLSARLSVTLLLEDPGDALLPSVMDFAVYRGRISSLAGSLGGFDVTIEGHASMHPSSREEPRFTAARDGVSTRCSVLLDLAGGAPLVAGPHKRDGYLRADPRDPAAVMRSVFEASELSGTFEKPIYASVKPDICAHRRSNIVGCTNCLDACPAGAISPDGDAVAVDAGICAGCGNCGSHCPTGAVSYLYPDRADQVNRIGGLLSAYLAAGGERPVLLVHDLLQGAELVNASARLGRGLPPNVIPVDFHSAAALGHDVLVAALAFGASSVVILTEPRKETEMASLDAEIALASAVAAGMGLDGRRVRRLSTSDPDELEENLYVPPLSPRAPRGFAPIGSKREVARNAMLALAEDVPAPFAVPEGAPYGRIHIDVEGCTLCLSCVSICPAGALLDNPDRPQVSFIEANCVQCGLCAKACPESVITLERRLDLSNAATQPRVMNEEEPAECVSCGKPFGVKSTIDRIAEQLSGKHYMFRSEEQARLIRMCDDCRIVAQAGAGGPFAGGERPRPRTTDDYLSKADIDSFLIDD